MALSNKQRVFIEAYLRSWNATQAAIEAGYSPKSARVIGHENLTKPDISAEITRRVDEVAMSANEVLIRMAAQARAEYSAYFMEDGSIDIARLIADGKGHLIKGVKDTQYGRIIEFYDAQSALVHIGKHHKLFSDNVEHSGEVVVRVQYGDEGSDT